MRHQIIKPPRHLERYIRFFWTIDCTDRSGCCSIFKMSARRFPRMIFQHANGHSGIYREATPLPISYLSGLNSIPYDCEVQSSLCATGVSFYPHSVKVFFDTDARAIVNELPDIENFTSKVLTDMVLNAVMQEQRIRILVDFFTKKLARAKRPDPFAMAGWHLFQNASQDTLIPHLLRTYNISERQLQRNFQSSVGFNPKQFLRITRFEKAVQMMQHASHEKLSDIAYELNYSDQSHFIREFREFSGYTPLDYIKQNKVFEETSAIIISKRSNAA